MAKFTSPFSIDLFLANIDCYDGFYRKGIFNYSWHYKTSDFIFEVDEINEKMYVVKIVKRNAWYQRNEVIFEDRKWIFGYRSCEHKVQTAFNDLMHNIKTRKTRLKKMGLVANMSYKDANQQINS